MNGNTEGRTGLPVQKFHEIVDRTDALDADPLLVEPGFNRIKHIFRKGKKILDAALKGRDLGLNMPLQGKATSSRETFAHLKETLSPNQKRLNARFEKMVAEDGLYTSYD